MFNQDCLRLLSEHGTQGKKGRITLSATTCFGHLFMAGGYLVHAQTEQAKGKAAAFQVLCTESGAASWHEDVTAEEQTIHEAIEPLLAAMIIESEEVESTEQTTPAATAADLASQDQAPTSAAAPEAASQTPPAPGRVMSWEEHLAHAWTETEWASLAAPSPAQTPKEPPAALPPPSPKTTPQPEPTPDSTQAVSPVTLNLEGQQIILCAFAADGTETEITLERGSFLMGRAKECDFQLWDPGAARYECSFTITLDAIILTDRGSDKGIWVNNQRIRETTLAPDDRIRIGSIEWSLHLVPRAKNNTATAKPSTPAKAKLIADASASNAPAQSVTGRNKRPLTIDQIQAKQRERERGQGMFGKLLKPAKNKK